MSLENPTPAIQPNWYRPNLVSGLTKTQHYRTEGLETKMTKEGDLISFQRAVLAKLEKYGMDTVSYLPNPADPTKVVCVITDDGWFNLDDGVKSA